jgi:hypothetical protein
LSRNYGPFFTSRSIGLKIGAVKASLWKIDSMIGITISSHILGNPDAKMPDGYWRGLRLFRYEKLGARFLLPGLKTRKAGDFPAKNSYLRSA